MGGVNVAVNWRLAPAEMLQIIDDAQAPVVIVGPDFFEQVEKIEDQLATVRTIVAIGDHPRWVGYDQWIDAQPDTDPGVRSEEHTSELQSLMRISYAVICLKKKKTNNQSQ